MWFRYKTVKGDLYGHVIKSDDGKYYILKSNPFGCKGRGYFLLRLVDYNYELVKSFLAKE